MLGGGSPGAHPLLVPETGIYSPFVKKPLHTTIGCGEQGFPSAQPYLSQYYERGQNMPEPSGARRFMRDGC